MTTTAPSPAPAALPRLTLDVWLDIACPWCAVGELRLTHAISSLPFAEQIDVRFRSFQLAPDAPERSDMLQPEFLASRGMDMTRFRAAQQQLVAMGNEFGFAFNQDATVPSNTHTAHRLIQAAGHAGVQAAVVEALFSAYFETGKDLGDPSVLRETVIAAGLSASEADQVLANAEAHSDAVARDIARATELGISGVPFVVIDNRYGLSGAQPSETFAEALTTAYSELTATQAQPHSAR